MVSNGPETAPRAMAASASRSFSCHSFVEPLLIFGNELFGYHQDSLVRGLHIEIISNFKTEPCKDLLRDRDLVLGANFGDGYGFSPYARGGVLCDHAAPTFLLPCCKT